MTSAIRVRRLRKRYAKREVFERLDLEIGHGETVAILGASGCGKSTLLRCIAGLVPPDGGDVAVDGNVGFVFQEPRLMPWLTVERNVAFAARDDVERARVRETLALVGLANATHLLPRELSGGMAQRVALARSLVRSPQILLLDEPLSALDALLRIELQTAIARIVSENALHGFAGNARCGRSALSRGPDRAARGRPCRSDAGTRRSRARATFALRGSRARASATLDGSRRREPCA